MRRSIVEEKTVLRCHYCDGDVYKCIDCDEYFKKGDIVYCSEFDPERHRCESCQEVD